MKRLTYLGVTHVVADVDTGISKAREPLEVVEFTHKERGAHSASVVGCDMLLVGAYWKEEHLGGCASLPKGAHWKAVHTFKVN